MPTYPEPPPRRFFILGLWMQPDAQPDQPVWRISLEDAQTAERKGFADLPSLAAYLAAWMELTINSQQSTINDQPTNQLTN